MSPELVLWGYLTHKADVYGFGVMALDIVSGKCVTNYVPSDNYTSLRLGKAFQKQQTGGLMELIDENLHFEVNQEEVEHVVKVAVLCTSASASLRPKMSEVVKMLEGELSIPDVIPVPANYRRFSLLVFQVQLIGHKLHRALLHNEAALA
ncbi:hypothetical protein CDL15_Pgr001113 [Punica granatum]|nr:hypothetical protein CDL15_Pgr001113 [Punica granatum]